MKNTPTTTLRLPTTAQTGALAVAVFAVLAAVRFSDWPNEQVAEAVLTLSFPLLGLVFVPLAALAACSTRGRSRAAWMSMTIAFTSWVLAEFIWAFYTLVIGQLRVPSAADVAYLPYVPAMLTALLLFPTRRSWRVQGRVILDGLILTNSFFLIAWLAALRRVWYAEHDSGLEFALSLSYPTGDFLILTLAFLVLLRVVAELRLTMLLLVAAFTLVALADIRWVYLTHSAGYTPGGLHDLLTAGAGLLILVALVAAYNAKTAPSVASVTPGRLPVWLPLVPLTVAALYVALAKQDVVLEPPVVIGVITLIAATLIRQVLEASKAVKREQQIRSLANQLATELDSAAKYVASILPGELTGPVQVSSHFQPSRALGGDSYGYTWIDDDHLNFYLIDVSGHGVEPALLSVSLYNLLRSGSIPAATLLAPDQLLAELNEQFGMESHGGHYFTMWYGVYQRSTGLVRYASAGHPPALALNARDGVVTATQLGGGSIPVGMFDDTEFSVQTYQVPADTRILLYSDGVLGEPPHMDKFVALCTEAAAEESPFDAVADRVPVAPNGPDEDDDCSLVQLTFTAQSGQAGH